MLSVQEFFMALSKGFGAKTKNQKANLNLPSTRRFWFGEYHERVDCDCDPPRGHTYHWVPERRLANDGSIIRP